MKLLHTSDWHLGKILHEHSLLEDQKYILDQILGIIESDPHDAMIIAGDIYDRSIPPADAIKILSDFFISLRGMTDMPVFIVPGNHDSSKRLSYLSEIIAMANIYIRTDPESVAEPVPVETSNVTADFYLIPFLNPSTYDVHDETEERPVQTHEGAIKEAVSRINLNRKNLNILVGHLFTRGGKTSDSERKFIGASGEVDASIMKGFDYAALGHLHRPQNPLGRIFYSGSPLKYSFSESEDKKMLFSVEVSKEQCRTNELLLEPKHDMTRLRGSLNDLMVSKEYDEFTDNYLEVELTDEVLFKSPIQELKKRYPNILSARKVQSRDTDNLSIPETAGSSDVEDDFMLFHRFIHEDKDPSAEKMRLFQEIRKTQEDN